MIRKLLVVLFLTCSCCWSVAAPASDASIRELMATAKVKNLVDDMFPQIDQMMQSAMQQSLAGKELSADDQKAVDTMRQRMMKIMREELSWEKLEPMYIKVYQDSFTQDEVDGILAFYKTPAGAALVNKMPLVMKNSMAAMQQRMGPLLQKIQAAIAETTTEIDSGKSK